MQLIVVLDDLQLIVVLDEAEKSEMKMVLGIVEGGMVVVEKGWLVSFLEDAYIVAIDIIIFWIVLKFKWLPNEGGADSFQFI